MKHLVITLLTFLSFSFTATAQSYFRPSQPNDLSILYHNKQRPVIFINEAITTHLVMPEPIKVVDISTDTIVGSTQTDNILRIKPKSKMQNNEIAGTITLIGERHIVYYDLVYTNSASTASPIFYIPYKDMKNYQNPAVSMSQKEMSKYAWAIYTSKRKYNNITANSFGCKMVVNNIYTIGDYFFIDFSLYNKSNISYEIDELRIKLEDKKQTKSTTSQSIELSPVFVLNNKSTFKKSYRNVIVLDRLTYPEEKLLYIEIYEKQLSGRSIKIPIAYEDILHADGSSSELIKKL